MEDEITKRELSDDELDNVSGGGCEENALFVVRGTGKFKAHSQSPWLAAF